MASKRITNLINRVAQNKKKTRKLKQQSDFAKALAGEAAIQGSAPRQ